MSFERVTILVADGLGVGETPDAAEYNDLGANTLGHVAEHVGQLPLKNLQKLGLGNLGNFSGISRTDSPLAVVGRLAEQSAGKDTTTGHWEIAGRVTTEAYQLFPEGFPPDLVDQFVREAEIPGVLGNKPASGTVIIEELGEEHVATGKPILYTSGDSVFQIAAHEEHFGLERLYKICEIGRKLTLSHNIGRVIARPFIGEGKGSFSRTEARKDYSIEPPPNLLDWLERGDVPVNAVGKIEDIFSHRGMARSNHTGNNRDGLRATLEYMKTDRGKRSLTFTNLVDFDMLYGHRRDPKGFAQALSDLDEFLPSLLSEMNERDCLILTGDHGCDPTYRGTDHTREYVPLVAYCPGWGGADVGDRTSFGDIAASILEGYGLSQDQCQGKSFLCEFKR